MALAGATEEAPCLSNRGQASCPAATLLPLAKDGWAGIGSRGTCLGQFMWGGAGQGWGWRRLSPARIYRHLPQAGSPVSEPEGFSGCVDGEMEAWSLEGLPRVSRDRGRRVQRAQAQCPALGSSTPLLPAPHLTEPWQAWGRWAVRHCCADEQLK